MRSGETPPGLFQQKSSSPGLEPDGFSQRTAPPAWPDYTQPELYADAAAASRIPVTAYDSDAAEDTRNIEKVKPHGNSNTCTYENKQRGKKRDLTTKGKTAPHFTDTAAVKE